MGIIGAVFTGVMSVYNTMVSNSIEYMNNIQQTAPTPYTQQDGNQSQNQTSQIIFVVVITITIIIIIKSLKRK